MSTGRKGTLRVLESSHERRFHDYVVKQGDLCLKIQKRHWPDRLVMIIDSLHTFFIEFKRQGESLKRGQRIIKERLKKQGATIYTCYNYVEARHYYDKEKSKAKRKEKGEAEIKIKFRKVSTEETTIKSD